MKKLYTFALFLTLSGHVAFGMEDESEVTISQLLLRDLQTSNPDTKTIRWYLENGANVNTHDAQNRTPIIWATLGFVMLPQQANAHFEAICILIEHKADVNAADKDGQSALSIVLEHDLTGLIQLYLENGPEGSQEIKVSSKQGSNPSVQNNNNE